MSVRCCEDWEPYCSECVCDSCVKIRLRVQREEREEKERLRRARLESQRHRRTRGHIWERVMGEEKLTKHQREYLEEHPLFAEVVEAAKSVAGLPEAKEITPGA